MKVWGSSQKLLDFYFSSSAMAENGNAQIEHYLVRDQKSKQLCFSTCKMMYCLQLGLQGTHSYRGIDINC